MGVAEIDLCDGIFSQHASCCLCVREDEMSYN